MWWIEPLDEYCERLGPGLWAEPLNLLSNAAFLVAALWLARQAWRDLAPSPPPPHIVYLVTMTAVVGLGSAGYHSLAVRGAMIGDVVPIGIYAISFLGIYLRLVMKATWPQVAGQFFGLGVVTLGLMTIFPSELTNHSNGYFGIAVFLAVFAWQARRLAPAAAADMGRAAIVFSGALVIRSIDMAFCAAWPFGTHFLWHILNAVVLWSLGRAIIAWTCREEASPP